MSMDSSFPACAKKMITLKSSDGVIFQVEERMVLESETIKLVIAENSDSSVELPDVNGGVLAVIIRYLKEVCFGDQSADKFVGDLPHDQMFGVVVGAYHLKIDPLYQLICQAIADGMKGKSTEEIRQLFNIVCDYTEAELKEVEEETSFFRDGLYDKKPERRSLAEIRAAQKQRLYAMRKKRSLERKRSEEN